MMIKTAATLLVICAFSAPATAGVNDRQGNQYPRIVQGWKSGELTRGEAVRLGRQQYRINRTEARMRADGGGLSRNERIRLHYRQDRASANIYVKKHNGRAR